MMSIRVGLVADPASPTDVARRMTDLVPPDGDGGDAWEIELLSAATGAWKRSSSEI